MSRNTLLLFICLLLMITACSATQPTKLHELQLVTNQPIYTSNALKVLTLNLAHGRKEAFNQLFLSRSQIQNNLEDISSFLNSLAIDVVALQEADAPSWWSGNFDHVKLIAEKAGYSDYVQTSHANSWLFSYGTAVLSRLPFTDTVQYTFQPSPPTMNKGFTLGQIAWQPDKMTAPILIDVVSVHLDFSRKSVREQQAKELNQAVIERGHPMIIMGDFNSDWLADEKVIRAITETSGFHVYRPEDTNLATYRSSNRRLDWIILSRELEFRSLTTYSDNLSDHFAVMAEVVMKASCPDHKTKNIGSEVKCKS